MYSFTGKSCGCNYIKSPCFKMHRASAGGILLVTLCWLAPAQVYGTSRGIGANGNSRILTGVSGDAAVVGSSTASRQGAGAAYQALTKAFWDWRMSESPELATSLGNNKYNDRLEAYTLQAMDHRQAKAIAFLKDIDVIELDGLTASEARNLALLRDDIQCFVDGYKWRLYGGLNPMNTLEGIHKDYSYWLDATVFRDADSYERYITRLTALATQVHEQIALMREAVRLDITNHIDSMEGIMDRLLALQQLPPHATQFYAPFNDSLDFASVSANMADKLRARGAAVIHDHLMPAYNRLSIFLSETYLPASRIAAGVSGFQAGFDFYKSCLRWYLSVDYSPLVLHELARRAVTVMLDELEEVRKRSGYVGQVTDFLKYAHGAKKFFYRTKAELLEAYKAIVQQRVPAQLSRVFGETQVTPIIVEEMRFDGPEAVLMPGSEDGSMPAVFFVNLRNPHKRPKWKLMTTVLHEYIPGRHFQTCYERNQSLPHFRKWREYRKLHAVPYHFPIHTAYTEGWALYAEYLGHDMNLYPSNYDRLGQYYSELWRSCEMVVDTGIHALGWSREYAEEYLTSVTACPQDQAAAAVTRIMTLPGQAVAPAFGLLKLKELRRKAIILLRKKFYIQDFHHQILKQGPVSLTVLQREVDAWIKGHLDMRSDSTYQCHAHTLLIPFSLAIFLITRILYHSLNL